MGVCLSFFLLLIVQACNDSSQHKELINVPFSGGEEWKLLAEKLGLKDTEIRYLDKRTMNPCLEALVHSHRQRFIDVGRLYDTLIECEQPIIADLL